MRRRDHIRGLLADADDPRHDQARRVMESYEKEWLAGQPILLAILHCVGLFDRPASGDCLKALRAKPAIPGLTDAIVDLTTTNGGAPSRGCAKCGCWRRSIRPIRKRSTPIRWCANGSANGCGKPTKRRGKPRTAASTTICAIRRTKARTPTLADLAPLYHAIAHGCRAGRYQEALDEVYVNRICRRLPDGSIEFYSSKKLGAVGSDLAAISWFFDRPYETPAAALTPPDSRLGPQPRPASGCARKGVSRRRCPRCARTYEWWKRRRIGQTRRSHASNLSETELLVGEIAAAVATAEKSVALADRSGDRISYD